MVTKMASTEQRENKDQCKTNSGCQIVEQHGCEGGELVLARSQIVGQQSLNAAFIATNGWSTQLKGPLGQLQLGESEPLGLVSRPSCKYQERGGFVWVACEIGQIKILRHPQHPDVLQ